MLGVCEFVHSRNGTFCQKITILRKWCPGGQKVQKSHFLHFWAQKWKITQKVHLGAKGVKSIQIALVKQGFAGILDHFYHFANQNGIGALSTMSEFSTQLQKKLSPLCPKTARGEKDGRGAHFVPLGVKIGILGQKCSFGGFGCHLRSTGLFLKDY